jgi:outer membrane protein OmpA-like peptidoglycan-associated protein
MNSLVTGLLGAALLLMLASGCSPRHTVILTADPDGHLGRAEVFTGGGKQLLDQPGGMTIVSGQSSAPSPVVVATPAFISALFAEAMAIEPAPPEKFMLYFNKGTTELVSKSSSTMTAILDAVKRRRAVNISISGHTDSSGSVQLNEGLARRRAQFISELLIQQGVDPERLAVSSHGKGNQLVPTADGVAEPRNRRVEVIVR